MPTAEQKIVPFLFEGDKMVRVVERGDDLWFVARDVCVVLGIQKPENAYARIPEDEKDTCQTGSLGGTQDTVIVSEPGLYRLIFRSDKPDAERFQHFVFNEVLPSIRRTGRYEVSPVPVAEDDDIQTGDGLKLRKVNTATRIFGDRAGAQLWAKLGLEMVPAMRPVLAQMDFLEIETVTTRVMATGSH